MRKNVAARSEDLIKELESLPKREQEKVFLRLIKSSKLRHEMEDLIDLAIAEEREKEARIPLDQVATEMRSRR